MAQDLTGQTLAERYRFDETIGEGTFAKVYRVHDLRRSVDLAAKVLRTDIAHEANFVERFRREADVLERLQHPNIVRYYDLVEAEFYVFILMEYVPGQTLQSTLYRLGQALTPREALEFLRPLSAALHFAHGEGIIHRDLKPANVMMHTNGNLLVTDFGIARLLDNAALSLTGGRALGTPLYMSPEQIKGSSVSAATDIYALGVMLYQMLGGRVPFDGSDPTIPGATTTERVTFQHLNVAPNPLLKYNNKIDESVNQIILRCLDKDPEKRPESVRAVYDLLAEAAGTTPADFFEDENETPPPPDLKLPEISQFDMKINPTDDSAEVEVRPAYAEKTVEVPAKPMTDDPSATAKSVPFPNHPASAQPAVQAPRQIPPPQYQPQYDEVYEEGGMAFDPMRFLLIGVALAMLACVALVIYALEPFGSNDDTPTPTTQTEVENGTLTDGTIFPTTTRLPTPVETVVGGGLGEPGSSIGDVIIYAARRGNNLQIYRMTSTGDDAQLIIPQDELEMQGPAWSPDGQRIAFYASIGLSTKPADIYIMNADGTNIVNITNTIETDDRYATWSPDGNYLIFHSNQPGEVDGSEDYELYSVDLETGTIEQLTFNNAHDLGPDWSPDGAKIAFHSYSNDRSYIYLINPDGSGRQQIDPDNITNNAFYATWSPDGKTLAMHVQINDAASNTQIFQVYILDMETGVAQPLMETYVNDQFPAWSPDGNSVIFQRVENSVRKIYRYNFVESTLEFLQNGYLPDWQPVY